MYMGVAMTLLLINNHASTDLWESMLTQFTIISTSTVLRPSTVLKCRLNVL